jgi:hypothetical protein
MRSKLAIAALVPVVVLAAALPARAGAKVKIGEDAEIDIGFRLQTLMIITEKDTDEDGTLDTDHEFKVRRGRLRVGADIGEWVSMFLQSELGNAEDGAGRDVRMIDAFITLKPCPWGQIVAGELMVPASRQNLTSSGAMMTMDRPGINYKTLSWGTRSVYAFANNTFADADAGLRGDVDVRDTGVTLFGSGSLAEELHLKYYAGAYNGIQKGGSDDLRYAGRVQVNMFDAEPKYFNASTYLGRKKTVGVGASWDTQNNVADTPDGGADYTFLTGDIFADVPLGPGSLTLEAAYENLDLDSATELDHDGDPLTPGRNAQRSAGSGVYVQAGYIVDRWQPWAGFETWNSNADDSKGDFQSIRVGLSCFIKGHNANIKVGYERLAADAPIGATSHDVINSVVAGVYVTY